MAPATSPHKRARHRSPNHQTPTRTAVPHPTPCLPPPHWTGAAMATTTHPNPCIISTPAPHPTPPPDLAHHPGRTRNQTETRIARDITMAHTPRLALLQTGDLHPSLIYQPPPPRSYQS